MNYQITINIINNLILLQMMEYYNRKRPCVCAHGYFRHPDGFCSTREGCKFGFRSI